MAKQEQELITIELEEGNITLDRLNAVVILDNFKINGEVYKTISSLPSKSWGNTFRLMFYAGANFINKSTRDAEKDLTLAEMKYFFSDNMKKIDEKEKAFESEKNRFLIEVATKKEELSKETQEKLQKIYEAELKLKDVENEVLPAEIKKTIEELKDGITKLRLTTEKNKMGEGQLFTRLQLARIGNDNVTPIGGANKEDTLVEIKENNLSIGKIRFDHKNIASWNNEYVEQMNRYIKDGEVNVGVIVTTKMPIKAQKAGKDVYFDEDTGVYIVSNDMIEAIYYPLRQMLVESYSVKQAYNDKIKSAEEQGKIVQKVNEFLSDSNNILTLKQVIVLSEEAIKDFEKIETSVNLVGTKLRKKNMKLKELVERQIEKYSELKQDNDEKFED